MSKPVYNLLNSLWRDERGATAIEFALIAGTLLLLIMAIIEFGLLLFTQVALENAVNNAGRTLTIGNTGGFPDRVSFIESEIRRLVNPLVYGDRAIISTEVVQASGARAFVQPELCLTNPPTLSGTCPAGTPFDDSNGNGIYDGGSLGRNVGNGEDLVQIDVLLPWSFFTPIVGTFFDNGAYIMRSSLVVKNEPF